MSKEFTYWTSVIKRIILFILIILVTFICFKLAIFYMPFLIAFIISLMIEPLIKKLMKKFKITRRLSSIIVFVVTFGIIIGFLTWGIVVFVSESTHLLESFNIYYEKISNLIQNLLNNFDFTKFKIPDVLLNIIKSSSFTMLEKIANNIQNFLTKIITGLTKIPTFTIYFAITLLALYFICTDKIYMLDELEHHLPEKWMKELTIHIRELIKILGGYLKSQAILILISFIICLIGLYILYFLGFNIEFPLIYAVGIGFVDALPILGSGTIMIPWGILAGINGDLKLGIAIIILWIIMSVIRQFIEPKIVSRKYWYTSNIYNSIYVYRIQINRCLGNVYRTNSFNNIKKYFFKICRWWNC